jgi:tyrosine-protein phosphatase SIW14
MVRVRWVLGVLTALVVVGVPLGYYRASYVHARRLRVVTEGKLYRCGQLPAAGFREAFQRFGIRTVVNIREEDRDPLLPDDWLAQWRGRKGTQTEAEVCRAAGVRYVQIDGGVIDCPEGGRPAAVDAFLKVCDDPANHPILVHCKAGRDRTGLMCAIWRMEYEGRTKARAVAELKANGFATFAATDGNAYLDRLILRYRPGVRVP